MTASRVSASIAFTKNLGNFESAKVQFSVEEDVRPDESNQDAAKRLYSEVDSWLSKAIAGIERDQAARME